MSDSVDTRFDRRQVLVQQCRWEADDVMSLRLVDPAGVALPTWEPGAHIDVILPSGTVRQYSLCGPPDDRDGYTIAVLREPQSRGGSQEIHETMLLGRTVEVLGPRNHFQLVDAEHYLLIAGGIGVTPILAMARQLSEWGRSFQFVYGGRSRRSMAFLDQLPARVQVLPQDEVGLPDLDAILDQAPAGTSVYCCGPEGLLHAVEIRCLERGLPLFVERFTTGTGASDRPKDASTGTVAPGATGGRERAFKVELRRTGMTLDVPIGRSILDVIREHVSVLSSCEEGFCGTCETRVIEGEPDHRDTVLSPSERAENKTMMICVGGSRSPVLALEL